MDPHPEQEEETREEGVSRGKATVAAVIGVIFMAIVVLHLVGGMSPHGS